MLSPTRSSAQVKPNAEWQSIHTAHFDVTFTPPLEAQARRAAVNAERAYALLASELTPPRGRVSLVISDDVDFSNGQASPFPTNRIVIYAMPPGSEASLRFTDDWNAMVVIHELTHIFHLDRSRGVWSLAQHVFGRAPLLFPNQYSPAWLTEGLAVYYESRFTGAGRVGGSEHRAIARAAAIDHSSPGLGALSLASRRYPFGESAYAYGSLFVDYLARTRGPQNVRRFVESSSAQLIPLLIDIPARRAFGSTFYSAWKQWRDSVAGSVGGLTTAPMPGWRELTRDGVFVDAPRWLGDSTLVYTGTPGKETVGAYVVGLRADRHRIGRRNEGTANTPLPDGRLLFARLEYTSPYELRSDLYIQAPREPHGPLAGALLTRARKVYQPPMLRLTTNARLSSPDARKSDGAIIAMQVVPAGTRIVRVSHDGRTITPLVEGGMDEQWSEPRWSHAGDRIAAVRWRRGGIMSIAVLDTLGTLRAELAAGHSIQGSPSWLPDDAGLSYISDRTGTADVYVTRFDAPDGGPGAERRLTHAGAGVFEPEVSRDGEWLAGVVLRGDGFHLGVGPCCAADTSLAVMALVQESPRPPQPAASDSSVARRYSPWHDLLPRFWLPLVGVGFNDEMLLGAFTAGRDVVGRHAWDLSIETPRDAAYVIGSATYEYAGLGNPVLQLGAAQDWGTETDVVDATTRQRVGTIRRRTRDVALSATMLRPRAWSGASLTLGAALERRDFAFVPPTLAGDSAIAATFHGANIPRVFLSAGWSNVQSPPFAISPEDGISAAATVRTRLRSGLTGTGAATTSAVAIARGFKSLNLPGVAHHVLAVRVSGGAADERASGYFEAGGVSGSSIELLPGYLVGEGSRSFPVRGFPSATLFGTRAWGWSTEWRIPLFAPSRGVGSLPFFFDRAAATLFAEGASAWCPDFRPGRQVCTRPEYTTRYAIASAGAEIGVSAAVLNWDQPYRFRLGLAHPVQGYSLFDTVASWTGYVAAGFSF